MIKYVLEQLYKFEDSRGSLDLSLDLVFKFLSSQLDKEEFAECNSFFNEIDIYRVRPTLAINLLAISIAHKDHLPMWSILLDRVRKHLTIRFGINKAELLLRGIA